MEYQDDDLAIFAAEGTPPLPAAARSGRVAHDGARIWFADLGGDGPPVVLLHGGLGHSGNFAHQAPALSAAGYRVVLIDSRGQGRSTRDDRPYSYGLMAGDVRAVMDELAIDSAAFVGWSDGACIAMVLADETPTRANGVFFFGCNMDPSGTKPLDESDPKLGRCFGRHGKDYAALSPTPDGFRDMVDAVSAMQRTQPDYSAADLSGIGVPVLVVQAEHDEFIRREHAEYLAATLPQARLLILPEVSHFAPVQRPAAFNAAILDFLAGLPARP